MLNAATLRPTLMQHQGIIGLAITIAGFALLLFPFVSANADAINFLQCKPFTIEMLPAPVPRHDAEAVERLAAIEREVSSGPHPVIFLGDSLTQKWSPVAWQHYFVPLAALNAGVNGDRTEHVLWRLKKGTLDGQEPRVVVLLIGTNDIGRNRPAAIVAEGVRDNLMLLRKRFPAARILLLGVLPRGESPTFRRRRQVENVNNLIRRCADGRHIHYLDLADVLLDPRSVLTRAISPDGVHLSEQAYSRLGARLAIELDRILAKQ